MNILIVVRYFPPEAGGGRSYRMAKLAKYLTNQGHKVVVLCTDEAIDSDNTLLNGINSELFQAVRVTYKPGKVLNLLTRIVKQVSAADGDLYFAYKLIDKLMKSQINMVPDIVFTSSAPYEVHLIGMYMQKRFGIKWVADFRDPYTLNHNYWSVLPIKKYFDKKLESAIYRKADGVVFNTNLNYDESRITFNLERYNTHYIVCQNGYDEDDVCQLCNVNTDKTILSYVGGIRGDKQERYFIDQVLRNEALLKRYNILVRFIGNGSQNFEMEARSHNEILETIGFCEQDQLQKYWNETDWLILFLPASEKILGWVPQKLYTYMSVNKPIIAAVPEGEAKSYLQEFSGNIFLDPNNYKLSDVIPMLSKKELTNDNDAFKKYEQKVLYEKLARWMTDEILNA